MATIGMRRQVGLPMGCSETSARSVVEASTEGQATTRTAMATGPAVLRRPMSTIASGPIGQKVPIATTSVET